MHFTKLRLHGFKSFVEPSEFLIEPGMTGIVGPNGCGKSNLVEALQWVMGETSARRLRGGDMDDVIFGGTATRPARNIAGVTVSLDNAGRTAPAAFNTWDELEIDRRIERGKGSTYRVNGKEFRARDVQMLFADAASGAQSSSLIGQGRIGWLINAKPVERRALLEEAAGIGGLQARRHEAELRLNAAETNLTRLQDVATGLVSQIERLKKQARQAERYRRLSEQLRLAEALVLYRHWLEQTERLKRAAERLADARAKVATAETASTAAEQARRAAHDALPDLREQAAAAAREAERLAGTVMALEAEARRVRDSLADTRRRLVQLEQDRAREANLVSDAAAARQRLAVEATTLEIARAGEAAAAAEAATRLQAIRSAVAEAESALAKLTAENAAAMAAREAGTRRLAAADERQRRLERQLAETVTRSQSLDLLSVSPDRLAAAEAAVGEADSGVIVAREAVERAEIALKQADGARQAARPPVQAAQTTALTLKAEIDALKRLAGSGGGKGFAPVLDGISVASGLETALGAALGDDLLASLDPAAPIRWTLLPDGTHDRLPDGATPLAVTAPAALDRRLARIGLVPDAATGRRLQPMLLPGQRLVTRDGAVFRWDGLTVSAAAPTAAAIRLAQRNRLAELLTEQEGAEAALAVAQSTERSAAAAWDTAQRDERAARAAQLQASQRSAAARQAQLALAQQHGQAEARRLAAEDARRRLATELDDATAQAAELAGEAASLPDPTETRREIERRRAAIQTLRQEETAQQRIVDLISRDTAQRGARLAALEAETRAWTEREAAAAAQDAVLAERLAALAQESAALATRPDRLEADRAAAASALDRARLIGREAAGSLASAEAKAIAAERAHEAAARIHGELREDRVRAEAAEEQAAEARKAASDRAREPFECPSEHLPRVAGIPPDGGSEPTGELTGKLDRLRREREAMGPVNLMAESEMAALEAELATLQAESDDLTGAIAKLRQAIQQLNREGRERLVKAFDAVNEHFQTLFVRLFGGGKAHLELVQPDGDPLAAGIEIMASPPGKTLQVLSLLSGGERALTALALIFATFLTNPAPVCVLDEVDAPLDDANVERFCNLVREIGQRTQTRFLIITHHRVSMARMDRLYGVTMTERGISQLVSVELEAAEAMRQTA